MRVFRRMGLTIEYEPIVFREGNISYVPDFRINGRFWVEVKGWMKGQAMQKIAAFRSARPNEPLILVDEPVYRAMEREWASRIPEWEYAPSQQYKAA